MAIKLADARSIRSRRREGSCAPKDECVRERTALVNLLRYKSNDLREDAALELGESLEMSHARAVELVARSVDVIADDGSAPVAVDRIALDLALHVTQPIRIPHMLDRMSSVLGELESSSDLRTVLDYGGGGGKDSILYARSGNARGGSL